MSLSIGTPAIAVPLLASTAILVAGVADDLRSRKFHNWLFVACSIAAVGVSFAFGGVTGLMSSFLGFIAGFAIVLPFVLMGMVGAGDMKLMAAFGIVAGWEAVLTVLLFSFIWGALFGIIRTALGGQLKVLASNLIAIVRMKDRKDLVLQKIPFTIAIFMGWLTHLAYRGVV